MTHKQVRERFLNSQEARDRAKAILREEWFKDWINCSLSLMGEYALDAQPSPLPHIQSEHIGGVKGISKFLAKLNSLPYEESTNQGPDDSYIGYTDPKISR